jgi:hypothetical protein
MPYKMVGKAKVYSYLTAGEEALYWQEVRESKTGGAVPVPARAMRPGSKYRVVTVGDQPPAAPAPAAPPEDPEGE